MTIVVAAILEAFLFRIEYKKALKKEDGRCSLFSTKAQISIKIYVLEAGQLSVFLNLTCTELSSLLGSKSDIINKLLVICHYSLPNMENSGQVMTFRGTKRQGVFFGTKNLFIKSKISGGPGRNCSIFSKEQ